MMLSIIVTLALSITTSCCGSRITHGEIVENITAYPYVVHLLISSEHVKTKKVIDSGCGGIILKPGIILTAGHCLYEGKRIITDIEITAGSVYRREDDDDTIERRFAAGFRIHKKFEVEETNLLTANHYLPNDIAIIWLKAPFFVRNNPKIQTAKFITNDIEQNALGDVVGWGQQEDGLPSRVLRRTTLKKISTDECKKRYKYRNGAKTFCAISLDRNCGISFGDSGGPFIHQGVVAGIISYGTTRTVRDENGKRKSLCDTRKPIVIGDIRMYAEWVNINLDGGAPEKKCKKAQQKYCAL